MRGNLLLLPAALTTALAASTAPALALPPGSYLETCDNYTESGTTLSASCRTRAGATERSSIDVQLCRQLRGTFTNDNGRLKCASYPPQGSYSLSCTNISVLDGILHASCWTRGNTRRASDLDVRSCTHGNVANIDGILRCIQ